MGGGNEPNGPTGANEANEANEGARERLHEVSEEYLRHTQKMEALGTLAGGLAHDFNNMLSVILAYSSMAADKLDPLDPTRGDVEEIQRAAEGASHLTRQLVAFSRSEARPPTLVEMNQTTETIGRMLRRLLGARVDLRVVAGARHDIVRVVPGQLEQVLVNLVTNARDAIPGGGQIRVETANVDVLGDAAASRSGVPVGSYVVLSVSDTGRGIEEAALARIFEPFFTTKGVGGTGLGLAVVRGIVEEAGGRVRVESRVGSGTTFRLYFPRPDIAAAGLGSTSVAAPGPRGTETILLVDDEEAVRVAMSRVLGHYGYTVLEAANAADALFAAKRHAGKIHLLLADVSMPRVSGVELAERFRTCQPDTKLLFISGYSPDVAEREGHDVPGALYLQKPVTAEVLLSRIREVLGESSGVAPA